MTSTIVVMYSLYLAFIIRNLLLKWLVILLEIQTRMS